MPRVLMLFEFPTLNGGERSALALIEGVGDLGFQIEAAAPADGDLARWLFDVGVVVHPMYVRDVAGVRRPRGQLRSELAELIQQKKPDLVHANSLSMSRLAGPVIRDLCLPSIGHLRDMMNVSGAAITDLNCHTRLLAVSQATRGWYVQAGLDAAKTHVMYNGVDLDEFRPAPANGYLHEELQLSSGSLLIGGIGQLGMRKGLDVTLAAAKRVLADFPQAHFLMVGQRYSAKQEAIVYERRLHEMAATAQLTGHVHFLGYRDDIPRFLNELTLLVHSARQEPLGRVLLEAAATGTPVIATDVGGTAEIFPRGSDAARLVPPDDADALADTIVALLSAPSIRRKMAVNARRRAERMFDARSAAMNLAQRYREILDVAEKTQHRSSVQLR